MGTTLSNGVYLPDEGERNCYAGLKVNWEILNQKVADIVALQLAIAGALHREIVASLPTTDIDPNTIYMILSGTSATENVYNEFMYVNNAWELIGTSATDLTNYYTKAEVDGKLLLKASASDLTSHTGDTTIHVTASDKTKWTNSANTHVLRLALSALTPSTSDNSFSNLDDSTALKVGDKVMDTAGVLFEVTAIDTQNSTFTIGTALIDLAQDSDVVHKSGDETVGGLKTFSDTATFGSVNVDDIRWKSLVNQTVDLNDCYIPKAGAISGYYTTDISSGANISNKATNTAFTMISLTTRRVSASDYQVRQVFYGSGAKYIRTCSNGTWSAWINETDKYVTTDTNQTISGAKTFSSDITLQGTTTPIIKTISNIIQDSTGGNESISWVIRDKTDSNTVFAQTVNKLSGQSVDWRLDLTSILNGTSSTKGIRLVVDPANESYRFTSSGNNTLDLGSSTNRWKSVYAMNYYYGSNDVEFSTKFVTTDTNQTISGNKTFSSINGVEPSSLSLPDTSNAIDISGYITDLTGSVNTYTALADGYVSIRITGTAMRIAVSNGVESSSQRSSAGAVACYVPVVAGETVSVYAIGTGINNAIFRPCQGNV